MAGCRATRTPSALRMSVCLCLSVCLSNAHPVGIEDGGLARRQRLPLPPLVQVVPSTRQLRVESLERSLRSQLGDRQLHQHQACHAARQPRQTDTQDSGFGVSREPEAHALGIHSTRIPLRMVNTIPQGRAWPHGTRDPKFKAVRCNVGSVWLAARKTPLPFSLTLSSPDQRSCWPASPASAFCRPTLLPKKLC
jgi:hypothetical protein